VRAGQRELTVRGDGENLIDFMYIDDAVDGLCALTTAVGVSATVDFASGAPVSVNDVVRAMGRTLGVEIAMKHAGHSEEYIQFHTIDRTMRERFGVQPTISFADGVARLHRFLTSEAV
jgi:nucleoside-diphosphate-sugar epimerase